MKTIREWLEELPEPYRSEALENMTEGGGYKMKESLKAAIGDAFIWQSTPQGYHYWYNLKNSL